LQCPAFSIAPTNAIKNLIRIDRDPIFISRSDPVFSGKIDPRFSFSNRIAIENPGL
jgi:hypothetical protein